MDRQLFLKLVIALVQRANNPRASLGSAEAQDIARRYCRAAGLNTLTPDQAATLVGWCSSLAMVRSWFISGGVHEGVEFPKILVRTSGKEASPQAAVALTPEQIAAQKAAIDAALA